MEMGCSRECVLGTRVRCVLDHDEGPREESLRLPLGLWPAAEFFLQERYNKNLTALRIFAASRDRYLFTA